MAAKQKPVVRAGLTRDEILAADDLKVRRVETPEWGGHVYVRLLSLAERQDFEAEIAGLPEGARDDVIASLVAMATVNEDGERLFTAEDIPALRGKASAAVMRVGEAAMALNAILERDVEALAKN